MVEEDPLDYVAFADAIRHGDPSKWKFQRSKKGSPVPARSPLARPGTTKHYDLYDDEFGDRIEVHYFRELDGTVHDVKVID